MITALRLPPGRVTMWPPFSRKHVHFTLSLVLEHARWTLCWASALAAKSAEDDNSE
jgi:hypothetical protein